MNTAHLHLILNHLPVLGAPMLLALLAYGLGRKLPEVTRIGLWCTAALGIVTIAVYLTGEPAEELVEALPPFDHDLVERHEEVALWATTLLVISAGLAGWALWSWRRHGVEPRTATRLVLAGLVVGTLVTMVTAWTGGPIGHPEIRP
jgi:uncharacterized membrane protein